MLLGIRIERSTKNATDEVRFWFQALKKNKLTLLNHFEKQHLSMANFVYIAIFIQYSRVQMCRK